MPKRVRNQYGVESIVPDDYPQDLMRQLQLEEVLGEGGDFPQQDASQEQERPRRKK